MSRQEIALGEPPEKLAGFPHKEASGRKWYRAHSATHGPWWFSSAGQGRFDLAEPNGTCYLASKVSAAIRERFGETLVRAGMISGAAADQAVVSCLPLAGFLADATLKGAERYGVTRELSTVVPYDLPQRWAEALRAAGYDGVRYWPRFSTDRVSTAVALFGAAGADDERGTDPAPVAGRAAARASGIAVFDPPRSVEVSKPKTIATQQN